MLRRRLLIRALRLGLLGAAMACLPILDPGAAVADSANARPWLGIMMDPADGQASGVRVGHVVNSSPASKAGIREGDRVVRVGSSPVSQGGDVVHFVSRLSVGDVVEIALVRSGQPQTVRVTLAAFPSQDDVMRMDLVGNFAPALRDVQGAAGPFPSSLVPLRGHVILLDFWATWCGPCRVVIPELDALEARFGAQGLTVVGVSTEEAQDVAAFAQHIGMRYGVGVDRHGQTTRAYGVGSLPTLVIIDKRGVVRDVDIGYDPGADSHLESTVRTLLAEPAPP